MPYFRIKLLSDLCVSNGESFGGVIDTDICRDRYGIPKLRGKSLKGCLREVAEELVDCGIFSIDVVDKLFGVKGSRSGGCLYIFDAVPEGYTDYVKDCMCNSLDSRLVTDFFTTTRTQTSIDDATGTAKRNSLRTTRVIKRGFSFICEYHINTDENQKFNKYFEECLHLLRHIGVNRTRGLGEVQLTICDRQESQMPVQGTATPTIEDGQQLCYIIETESLLISSTDGHSRDYVAASAVLGLLINLLGEKTVLEYLGAGLSITNALPSDGSLRYSEIPAFFAKQKESVYSDSGLPVYIFDTKRCDNAAPPALGIKGMKTAVSSDLSSISSLSVHTEINYHHMQSQTNPGIVDGVNFYQLTALSCGQRFVGFIRSKNISHLQSICDILSKKQFVNLGYYKTSGYGKCRISISAQDVEPCLGSASKVAVCLTSPVILYDEYGMPTANPKVFMEYFAQAVGSSVTLITKYLRYTDVGGFNTTWGMRKPRFQAFDAGTCFVVMLDQEKPLSELNSVQIGERQAEGYGELQIFDYDQIHEAASKELFITKAKISKACTDESKGTLSNYIDSLVKSDKIRRLAYERGSKLEISVNPSLVGRLSLMLSELPDTATYDDFKKKVDTIKDTKQREKARSIIDISNLGIDETDFREYLDVTLTHIKYLLRKREE